MALKVGAIVRFDESACNLASCRRIVARGGYLWKLEKLREGTAYIKSIKTGEMEVASVHALSDIDVTPSQTDTSN